MINNYYYIGWLEIKVQKIFFFFITQRKLQCIVLNKNEKIIILTTIKNSTRYILSYQCNFHSLLMPKLYILKRISDTLHICFHDIQIFRIIQSANHQHYTTLEYHLLDVYSQLVEGVLSPKSTKKGNFIAKIIWTR